MDEFNTANPAQKGPEQELPHKEGGAGALIGAAIVIILLALGALYFWGAKLDEADNPPPLILGDESAAAAESEPLAAPTQGSDEADDIYSDISAMDVDQIAADADRDVQAIGN